MASSPPQETLSNERAVMASRASSAGEVKRPDYGWLAAAIRARIEEIKRYSEQARSNGWEGRVVVATTVKADGRLMDIRVVESSGNGSLDEDAKQILRDTSPLVLSQPLEAAQVTVRVPIVFGLHR
jgi:TonB family protein